MARTTKYNEGNCFFVVIQLLREKLSGEKDTQNHERYVADRVAVNLNFCSLLGFKNISLWCLVAFFRFS